MHELNTKKMKHLKAYEWKTADILIENKRSQDNMPFIEHIYTQNHKT
jgi:hypothetical protein